MLKSKTLIIDAPPSAIPSVRAGDTLEFEFDGGANIFIGAGQTTPSIAPASSFTFAAGSIKLYINGFRMTPHRNISGDFIEHPTEGRIELFNPEKYETGTPILVDYEVVL
jgi:hypothetical protein